MKINPDFVERLIVRFIKEEFSKLNFETGILGLSGGLDSSVCAFLSVKALGPKNIIGLIMPYKNTFSKDVKDAENIASHLGISSRVIDISPIPQKAKS